MAQVFCSAFQALLYALCYHLEGLLGRAPKAGADPAAAHGQQARPLRTQPTALTRGPGVGYFCSAQILRCITDSDKLALTLKLLGPRKARQQSQVRLLLSSD